MKIIVLVLLSIIVLTNCSYNTKIAHKLIIASSATFAADAEINQWTCQVCKLWNLTNTHTFNNPILNVSGFTAFSRQDNSIVVAFRDTVNIQNWIATLDAAEVSYPGCNGCLVHQGFYNVIQSIEGYLRADIQKLMALYRDSQIWITGFGVGGALATLAALDIKQIFNKPINQFYSFGQPRVGNQYLSMFFSSQVSEHYRVILYGDIVPHLPPQIPIPYSHFAYQVWYDQNMKTYKVCGAEEWTCSKSLLPSKWTTTDHDPSLYLKLPYAQNMNHISRQFK